MPRSHTEDDAIRLLSPEFKARLDRVERRRQSLVPDGDVRRAVLDLDGTLIAGDIGEAVFGMLLNQGEIDRLNWSRYQELLDEDRERAYRSVVETMGGLSYETVAKATLNVMASRTPIRVADDALINPPSPHPGMRALVAYLHSLGYAVHVLTASNHISASIVCGEWFGIPSARVFGIRQVLDGRILTPSLISPVPVGSGKAETYHQFISEEAPVMTASDSFMDLPLFSLTGAGGIAVWAGADRESERRLRRLLPSTLDVCSSSILTPAGADDPYGQAVA